MDFISVKEAANKWNVSIQTIIKCCSNGRIVGAYKEGKRWFIPQDADFCTIRNKRDKTNFTFIDLFCGVGGFHQAMHNLGGTCVFACDIKTNCRDVYINNYCKNKEFPVMGDICEAIAKKSIPKFDVLCGGFPCQTFSKAGLQHGFDVVENDQGVKDERGQLFYRIIDILKTHKECKYVVLENVRNLADKKDNWNIICSELKQLGFVITEQPLIASPHEYGIPQVRERVFILGIHKNELDKRKNVPTVLTHELLNVEANKHLLTNKDNCFDTILEVGVEDKYKVPEDVEEVLNIWEEFRKNVKGLMSPFWIHKAGIGIYGREEYYADQEIGFADMPEWKKTLAMRSRVIYENNYEYIDEWIKKYDMRSRTMLHQKFEWNAGDDCKTMRDGIVQIRQSGIRVKRPNYFPSLVVMRNTPIVWDNDMKHYRYITPKESAKLQSFKRDFIFSSIDSVSYEQLGNSVNVKLVEIFASELFKLGKSIRIIDRTGE